MHHAFPKEDRMANPDQADADADRIGDACDTGDGGGGGGGGGGGAVCGNGSVELPDEECDLGPLNGTPGSPCTAACESDPDGQPILGCDGLSLSSVVPAFVKSSVFKRARSGALPLFVKFKNRTEFNLFAGMLLDPSADGAHLLLNQGTSVVADVLFPPAQ
jgi:hypothetical protein